MPFFNDIWLSTLTPPRGEPRPALFLDRDGVLVKEVHYLKRVEDVAMEDGAADIIKWAKVKSWAAICVTNQSGIARGLIGWAEYEAVHEAMTRALAAEGTALDLTLACPFHPDYTPGYGEAEAAWRKPGSRMLEHAAELMNIDLTQSWMIGDKASDIEAARNAGLKGAILLRTGHGTEAEEEKARSLGSPQFHAQVQDGLADMHSLLEKLSEPET